MIEVFEINRSSSECINKAFYMFEPIQPSGVESSCELIYRNRVNRKQNIKQIVTRQLFK